MNRKHLIWSAVVAAVPAAAVATAWALRRVDFFAPVWLAALALVPLLYLVAAKGISGLPSRTNAVSVLLRSLLFFFLVLCLADIQVVLRNEGLCVLYVLDHSASVPESVRARQIQYVNATASAKSRKDTAGVVIFGEKASMEVIPQKDLKIERIYSAVGRAYTDIQGAVELAAAAFPAEARKKVVLITDGNENRGNLLESVSFAAANGAVVDILPVTYDYDKEVLVEKVFLPDRVKENETFDLRVHVLSRRSTPAELSIYRNGACVAREKLDLKAGRNSYAVALKIEEPGFYAFAARVSAEADTVLENNEATGYVYIQGASRVLFVAPSDVEVRPLADACRGEDIEADIITPDQLPDSLGLLQNHDCVVLANVPADELTQAHMTALQANVRDLGVGLVMLGGQNSFGAGGYQNTPVEEALPVTMDIKQKKINPKGALALILHTCEFADGNYWAKQISKKAIETVNRQDEVGVLLYGNRGEEWLFELRPAEDKRFMFSKIDQASPGDMPSFEPTIKMAHQALSKSDAMVRHVIVISDGDPARPPPQLVKDMATAGITISTVAINPHSPRDVDVMKYLAYETGGRYYFASDPTVLPQIFVKEAKVVKRSLVFNQKFQPLLVLSTEVTKGIAPEEVPPLMAYVATTPKPTALVPMVSDNENRDPVLAYWRYGLGKSLAFTSDATSNWGKQWVPWDKYKKFWSQAVRWASRQREKSPLRLHTEIQGGRGRLVVDAVDPQGRFINFLKLTGRIVGPDNQGAPLDVRQTAPGRYEASFAADKVGVNIVHVGYQNPQTGGQGFAATGVAVPYSAEFHEMETNRGLLRRAAAAAGGRLLTGNPKEDRVFTSPLPPTLSYQPVWEFLLAAALCLFLVDITIRRVVFTRDDLRQAWASLRARLTLRRRAGESDRTMAALLRRKQKTFERVAGPAEPPAAFKRKLDREASGATGAPPVETATPSEPAPPPAALPRPPPGRPTAAEPRPSEDSYTGRLLAAKKRAMKKGEERDER